MRLIGWVGGCLLAVGGWPLAVSAGDGDVQRPPNVVFLLGDDQAWTDFGFMGHPVIQTPHLDRLARQGAVFPRSYVPTALCRPSLATMITGLYAHQHKITGNDPSHRLADPATPAYAQLRSDLIAHLDQHPTLPRLLAGRGYVSFQAGKWWEGNYRRGGFTAGMTRGFPEPGGRHGDDGLTIGRQGVKPVTDFIDQAVADQRPFYVWYAPFLPHTPHTPPERLLNLYRAQVNSLPLARYYAMCHWYDETCGQLIDHVEQLGQSSNTLFIVIGDNGWIQNPEAPGFAARSKQTPYEGGVRQPLILRWTGVIDPQERTELVSSIDLAPTILAAAGLAAGETMPGINLLPVVCEGKMLQRDAIFGEGFAHDIADLDDPQASLLYRWVIQGRWKLILTYDGQLGRYADVHPRQERRPQLFNLLQDPHEAQNLAADHPQVVQQLAERIAGWWPVTQRQVIETWTP